jgi:hypothetical protein
LIAPERGTSFPRLRLQPDLDEAADRVGAVWFVGLGSGLPAQSPVRYRQPYDRTTTASVSFKSKIVNAMLTCLVLIALFE